MEANIKNELQLFLLDTLEYYTTDPKRRCVVNGKCRYSPVTLGMEGQSEGCAYGRKMTPENALKADSASNYITTILRFNPEFLPNWMQKVDDNIHRYIQKLHDYDDNWDKNGLTDKGKNELLSIIQMSELPKEPFKKYL